MELSPSLYHLFVRPNWFNNNFIKTIISKNINFKNKSVLDFGCGIGSTCFIFKPKNYLGIDLNEDRIKYARKKYVNYKFDTFKNNKVNITDNSIDLIIVIAVLHHIPSKNITKILSEFQRILKKPQGEVAAIEPCIFPKHKYKNFYMKTLDRGRYIRNRENYLNLFKTNNFEINLDKKISKLAYKELFFTASPK
jgi:ubiquinone/menaquinone biosynthesis C-methylase UbiE